MSLKQTDGWWRSCIVCTTSMSLLCKLNFQLLFFPISKFWYFDTFYGILKHFSYSMKIPVVNWTLRVFIYVGAKLRFPEIVRINVISVCIKDSHQETLYAYTTVADCSIRRNLSIREPRSIQNYNYSSLVRIIPAYNYLFVLHDSVYISIVL